MTLGITDSNPCRNHKLTSKPDIFSLWLLLIFFRVHKSQRRFKLISNSTQLLRIDVDAYGMTPLLAASVTGRDLMLMKTTLAVIMAMISAIMTLVAMMVTVILLATMVTLVAWSISMATVEKLLDVRPDRSPDRRSREIDCDPKLSKIFPNSSPLASNWTECTPASWVASFYHRIMMTVDATHCNKKRWWTIKM